LVGSQSEFDPARHLAKSSEETDPGEHDDFLVNILEEIAMMDSMDQRETETSGATSGYDDIEVTANFFHRLLQVHSTFVESRLQGHEITLRQFALLSAVSRLKNPTQRDLTDGIGMDRSTLSDVVRRLSSNGLVRQEQSKEDRRAQVISLTAEGRKAVDRIAPLVRKANRDFLGVLSKDELQALVGIQGKLLRLDGSKTRVMGHPADSEKDAAGIAPAASTKPRGSTDNQPQGGAEALNRLQRARAALDAGLITSWEFEAEKTRFLDGGSS